MSDPSLDIPNVCPTCGSDDPAKRGVATPPPNVISWLTVCTESWHARPAVGSSSPDVAALAERLRAEEGHPDGGDITLDDLRAAADELEAQAARITELENGIRDYLDTMKYENVYPYELETLLNPPVNPPGGSR